MSNHIIDRPIDRYAVLHVYNIYTFTEVIIIIIIPIITDSICIIKIIITFITTAFIIIFFRFDLNTTATTCMYVWCIRRSSYKLWTNRLLCNNSNNWTFKTVRRRISSSSLACLPLKLYHHTMMMMKKIMYNVNTADDDDDDDRGSNISCTNVDDDMYMYIMHKIDR